MNSSHGVLVVDKPEGPTSHELVQGARRLYETRAVGHAGTLDPMATGVLLLLVGEACKLSNYLTSAHKTYLATVSFGRTTDTWDRLGRTLEERAVSLDSLEEHAFAAAVERERRRSEQSPPPFSALKVNGKRAYALARKGAPPELAPRRVEVYALETLELDGPNARFRLCVSKGYYVRSFAFDLGRALGLPAHLSELRRVSSGPFDAAEAVRWPQAEPPRLLSVEEAARRSLPSLTLSPSGVEQARAGRALGHVDFSEDPELAHQQGPSVAWFSPEGELIALGARRQDPEREPPAEYRVLRGFNSRAVSSR